jgi:hypothetical protein
VTPEFNLCQKKKKKLCDGLVWRSNDMPYPGATTNVLALCKTELSSLLILLIFNMHIFLIIPLNKRKLWKKDYKTPLILEKYLCCNSSPFLSPPLWACVCLWTYLHMPVSVLTRTYTYVLPFTKLLPIFLSHINCNILYSFYTRSHDFCLFPRAGEVVLLPLISLFLQNL